MTFLNVLQVNSLKWNNSKLIPHDSPSSRYNRINVLKNYENFDGIFEIVVEVGKNDYNTELETNIGITNSFITAVECLGSSLYSASILFASTTVECILNHDMSLDQYRLDQSKDPDKQWIMLNEKNLRKADEIGIPVKLLCDSSDNFPKDVKFVVTRNKIAHGDTEGYRKTHMGAYSSKSHSAKSHTVMSWQPEREDALNQIRKVKNFVEAWGKTNPKLRLH